MAPLLQIELIATVLAFAGAVAVMMWCRWAAGAVAAWWRLRRQRAVWHPLRRYGMALGATWAMIPGVLAGYFLYLGHFGGALLFACLAWFLWKLITRRA